MAPVVLTCGDPSGIGLEIALRAADRLAGGVPFVLLADRAHLEAASRAHAVPLIELAAPKEAMTLRQTGLAFIHHEFGTPYRPGVADPATAAPTISAIERAVAYVQAGEASALCTNPITKALLVEGAGFTYPGHTEFLAALARQEHSVMMLVGPHLKVVPATIHIPLSEVPKRLTAALLERVIRITHDALQNEFGIAAPRLAVTGLNPHAGENGLMGHEDDAVIAPVLATLRAEGMALRGPLPADTLFHARARQGYDAAICMYHDQALIPVKTLDFDEGVNMTLGLPFIRTSPDHGTAYDIAGKGVADPSSLVAALRLAYSAAQNRATGQEERGA